MGSLLIGVISVAVCSTSYTLYYGLSSPWWKTWTGRAIFTLGAIIAAWFDLGIAIRHWPMPPLATLIASWTIVVIIDASFITLLSVTIYFRCKDRHRRRAGNRHTEGSRS